ncbi:PREDICTED: 1-acyl-sn-glycerol-3-phosphate acyltransferase alpha-like [Thamnophis sirtalis]|uniref:1-acylglycerol-3-phosphate O-acyltransferase n=1 Tax=Thamnophis sirtalis TaxID=35019 RepID=A0A6I9XGP6_9SAUR|nr:PREDICTED: 1-acyl-sn-glycerol-3-phosphate acyltransferase alpha-like [Thamnophis sirtalis]
MEISPGQWLLILFLVAIPLLYEWSATFKYFCKMAFYNSYILFLAIIAIPICAVRGRDVENMRVLRFMLLHIKYLYGIKIEVRGTENFNIKEPYVVVSNHQSSLDLLGRTGGRCGGWEGAKNLIWALLVHLFLLVGFFLIDVAM